MFVAGLALVLSGFVSRLLSIRPAPDRAEHNRAILEQPDVICDLAQPDRFCGQHLADEDAIAFPFDLALAPHLSDHRLGRIVR